MSQDENNKSDQQAAQKPSPWSAGLRMKCPMCGNGPLFDGFLTVRKACVTCHQDFTVQDTADGPAVIIMLVVSVLVLVPVYIVEFVYNPPYWVYGVTVLPALIILSLVMLRPLKGVMFALQMHFSALEIGAQDVEGKDGEPSEKTKGPQEGEG